VVTGHVGEVLGLEITSDDEPCVSTDKTCRLYENVTVEDKRKPLDQTATSKVEEGPGGKERVCFK